MKDNLADKQWNQLPMTKEDNLTANSQGDYNKYNTRLETAASNAILTRRQHSWNLVNDIEKCAEKHAVNIEVDSILWAQL